MSRLSNILPLIFLFIGVGFAALVGYIVYSIVMDVKSQTQKKMEKKNVMFSRDGMKVGVKEIDDEEYKDRSQRYVCAALRCVPRFLSGRRIFGVGRSDNWCAKSAYIPPGSARRIGEGDLLMKDT
jgi:hypothetical protein